MRARIYILCMCVNVCCNVFLCCYNFLAPLRSQRKLQEVTRASVREISTSRYYQDRKRCFHQLTIASDRRIFWLNFERQVRFRTNICVRHDGSINSFLRRRGAEFDNYYNSGYPLYLPSRSRNKSSQRQQKNI